MTSNQKTALFITVSTAVGFVGDVFTYSFAESKGKKFALHMPKGKQLVQVIIFGIVSGVLLDAMMNGIVNSLKSQQEKDLEKLVKADLAKIEAGELKVSTPIKIQWAA